MKILDAYLGQYRSTDPNRPMEITVSIRDNKLFVDPNQQAGFEMELVAANTFDFLGVMTLVFDPTGQSVILKQAGGELELVKI